MSARGMRGIASPPSSSSAVSRSHATAGATAAVDGDGRAPADGTRDSDREVQSSASGQQQLPHLSFAAASRLIAKDTDRDTHTLSPATLTTNSTLHSPPTTATPACQLSTQMSPPSLSSSSSPSSSAPSSPTITTAKVSTTTTLIPAKAGDVIITTPVTKDLRNGRQETQQQSVLVTGGSAFTPSPEILFLVQQQAKTLSALSAISKRLEELEVKVCDMQRTVAAGTAASVLSPISRKSHSDSHHVTIGATAGASSSSSKCSASGQQLNVLSDDSGGEYSRTTNGTTVDEDELISLLDQIAKYSQTIRDTQQSAAQQQLASLSPHHNHHHHRQQQSSSPTDQPLAMTATTTSSHRSTGRPIPQSDPLRPHDGHHHHHSHNQNHLLLQHNSSAPDPRLQYQNHSQKEQQQSSAGSSPAVRLNEAQSSSSAPRITHRHHLQQEHSHHHNQHHDQQQSVAAHRHQHQSLAHAPGASCSPAVGADFVPGLRPSNGLHGALDFRSSGHLMPHSSPGPNNHAAVESASSLSALLFDPNLSSVLADLLSSPRSGTHRHFD